MYSIISTIALFLPIAIVGGTLAFWAWMFRDMQNNPDIPRFSSVVLAWPPQSKAAWTYAFFFFSLLTPAYYYVAVPAPPFIR
ncbi:MAG TPA: hypothetical protein VLF59_00020 [Candidatus Saccharimonadales bacterium]|nr:hypothetical protein [Candidatus Saccharimonadales bacterium]